MLDQLNEASTGLVVNRGYEFLNGSRYFGL